MKEVLAVFLALQKEMQAIQDAKSISSMVSPVKRAQVYARALATLLENIKK